MAKPSTIDKDIDALINKHGGIPPFYWTKDSLTKEDVSGWTPLCRLIFTSNLDKLPKQLLTPEILNQFDSNGLTPLHRAIGWGKISQALILLGHGADPRIKTKTGKSCEDLCLEIKENKETPHSLEQTYDPDTIVDQMKKIVSESIATLNTAMLEKKFSKVQELDI